MTGIYGIAFLFGLFLNYGSIECIGITLGFFIPKLTEISLDTLLEIYYSQKQNVEMIQSAFILGILIANIRIISFTVSILLGSMLYYNRTSVYSQFEKFHFKIITYKEEYPKVIHVYSLMTTMGKKYIFHIKSLLNKNESSKEE